MEKTKESAEEILKLVIIKTIAMNQITGLSEDLEERIKITQRATALTILEPAFEYMIENYDASYKKLAEAYKEQLNTLKERGVIEVVEDVNAAIKELKEKLNSQAKKNDEKNNNTDG